MEMGRERMDGGKIEGQREEGKGTDYRKLEKGMDTTFSLFDRFSVSLFEPASGSRFDAPPPTKNTTPVKGNFTRPQCLRLQKGLS